MNKDDDECEIAHQTTTAWREGRITRCKKAKTRTKETRDPQRKEGEERNEEKGERKSKETTQIAKNELMRITEQPELHKDHTFLCTIGFEVRRSNMQEKKEQRLTAQPAKKGIE